MQSTPPIMYSNFSTVIGTGGFEGNDSDDDSEEDMEMPMKSKKK